MALCLNPFLVVEQPKLEAGMDRGIFVGFELSPGCGREGATAEIRKWGPKPPRVGAASQTSQGPQAPRATKEARPEGEPD